jgi:hypothetical protein
VISFEVFVNGERFCLAGVGERGVLSAIATWSQRTGPPPPGVEATEEEWTEETLELDVGGFYRNGPTGDGEHLRWLKRELKPGDVITINIVETESWDEPSTRTPYVSKDETERERQYYMRLKRKFEASDTT